ncbi:hypothetical protein [Lutibacter sp.]|uniref:hypothetical protein n=1 Tax=Lutibacter sp. TaxID=1925666 RepID=UPI0035631FDD
MTYNRFTSNNFLFSCTFYKNNPDCPFVKLRRLAIEERVSLLKKMTFQEINIIESIHKGCLKERKYLKQKLIY